MSLRAGGAGRHVPQLQTVRFPAKVKGTGVSAKQSGVSSPAGASLVVLSPCESPAFES